MAKAKGTHRVLTIGVAFLAACLLGVACLVGCSQDNGQKQEEPPAESSAPAESSIAVPVPDTSQDAPYTVEAGDEAATASFILQNDAEMQPVFGIAVRPAANGDPSAEYTECPFTVGDRLVPGMRCLVRYDGEADLYDVRVTYADGSEDEIAGIALGSLGDPLHVGVSEDGSVVFS